MPGPETPQTLVQRAEMLQRSGRSDEAIVVFQRLLGRWPEMADSWYNLALLQRQAGRFEAALASYQQALDRGASQPEEIHLNRGVIYSDCLRMDEAAEKELQTAIALNPKYIPALLNLGNLNEDRGDRETALALYERILVLDPNRHDALARYANLNRVSGPQDPLIQNLEAAISRTAVPDTDRASLGFALGKLLNDCGAYDRAFDAYARANRDSRNSAGRGRVLYDRNLHERLIDRLIETPWPRRPVSSDAAASDPIFICGMFRSGSTLVEQVLASHPRVTAGGELPLLPAIVASELAPFPASIARQSPASLDRLAGNYRDQISKLFTRADRVTDKRPDNFLYVGLIKSMFPRAKIINTKRNALDNCLSVYFLHLDHSMGYALDLSDTAHYYGQYVRLMAHWKSLYGADILDFDYDDFVGEPRPAVERLLRFCGLEWDDTCLSFHQTKTTVKTASVWQVREPLYRHSSGRWRNYAQHLTPLQAYLDEFVSHTTRDDIDD
ncbi:MAG: sulfotransferase [Micropepsaceae bacterium]